MRTLTFLGALIATTLLLTSSAPERSCAAGYCPATPCVNSSVCLSGCVCLHSGPGMGTCVGID